MKEPFHEGEIAVQERVGVRPMASKIGHGIHDVVPLVAQAFLRERCMIVVATANAGGTVWASLLAGAPGFVETLDERSVRIDAEPPSGDPLAENLHPGAAVGLLAIDFATRQRVRVNGTVASLSGRGFVVRPEQVYGNCPKYIQRRDLSDEVIAPAAGRLVSDTGAPTGAQRAWIEAADTFFIATAHPEGGADASHRGGNPGFVRFADERTLLWPDYSGNMMFQTLGNLAVHPAAGLLFLDFERGATLQLTGNAKIVWDPNQRPGFPGAERLIELRIERVIEMSGRMPAGWRFVEYSPSNAR